VSAEAVQERERPKSFMAAKSFNPTSDWGALHGWMRVLAQVGRPAGEPPPRVHPRPAAAGLGWLARSGWTGWLRWPMSAPWARHPPPPPLQELSARMATDEVEHRRRPKNLVLHYRWADGRCGCLMGTPALQ
jgi:hypothetical protein